MISVALGCLVGMHKALYTICVFSSDFSFFFGTEAPNDSHVDQGHSTKVRSCSDTSWLVLKPKSFDFMFFPIHVE